MRYSERLRIEVGRNCKNSEYGYTKSREWSGEEMSTNWQMKKKRGASVVSIMR
jgi:hypothetical protein